MGVTGKPAEFFEISTFHGLADILQTRSRPLKLFWTFCLLFLYAYCGYEVVGAVLKLGSDSIVTEVEHEAANMLPNLTVCAVGPPGRSVAPDGTKCDESGDFDSIYSPFDHVASHFLVTNLVADEYGCEYEVDASEYITGNPDCSSEVRKSSRAINYEANILDRWPDWAGVSIAWYRSNSIMEPPPSHSPWFRHLNTDHVNNPRDFCTTYFKPEKITRSHDGYFDVELNNSTQYTVTMFDKAVRLVNQNPEKNGYVHKIFITLSKMIRLRKCHADSEMKRTLDVLQCSSDVLHEKYNCCICGYGVRCAKDDRCCSSLDTCKATLEEATIERFHECRKDLPIHQENPVPQCVETTFATVETKEHHPDLVDMNPRLHIIFQNLFQILVFQEKPRYDVSWFMSTIGGFLGLLIGGSVLSFLQALLFCMRLGFREAKQKASTAFSFASESTVNSNNMV